MEGSTGSTEVQPPPRYSGAIRRLVAYQRGSNSVVPSTSQHIPGEKTNCHLAFWGRAFFRSSWSERFTASKASQLARGYIGGNITSFPSDANVGLPRRFDGRRKIINGQAVTASDLFEDQGPSLWSIFRSGCFRPGRRKLFRTLYGGFYKPPLFSPA